VERNCSDAQSSNETESIGPPSPPFARIDTHKGGSLPRIFPRRPSRFHASVSSSNRMAMISGKLNTAKTATSTLTLNQTRKYAENRVSTGNQTNNPYKSAFINSESRRRNARRPDKEKCRSPAHEGRAVDRVLPRRQNLSIHW